MSSGGGVQSYAIGGIAGMSATFFVQPLDLVKNRLQVMKPETRKNFKTSGHFLVHLIKKDGFLGLYSGLSAGLFRQATYTTARLGIYSNLFEMFAEPGKTPNFGKKCALGMTAGGLAAMVGTPAEVCLIRMTTDQNLPVDQRRNYANVFSALARITREEGVATLWRGCMPTVIRAMVVNAAQLASYSQAKESLFATGYFADNIVLHFCASMTSGLVTTVVSMPVDITKTKLQSMKMIDGKPEFTGVVDVLRKTVSTEGVFALWKGFTPYLLRIGPHTVLTFIFLEQLKKVFVK